VKAVTAAVLTVLGLCVGSFLNVVIARLPEGRSLVRPRSACPRCGALIAWYDNVPLLSFTLLAGRCRRCRAPIPWRYPVVEAATGGVFLALFLQRGLVPDLVPALALAAALVAITVIDLDHQIIPDAITLPGTAAGLGWALATGRPGWWDALLGILLGGGLFFVIIVASRGGMGGGDMKLGAMLGAFLGWKILLVALLLAILTGGLVAVALLALGRAGRKDAVPFGPFLALGGLVALLWGQGLLGWYLGILDH
jgi:leader peptidase (prepilin peptidase)/N-methyltransferase